MCMFMDGPFGWYLGKAPFLRHWDMSSPWFLQLFLLSPPHHTHLRNKKVTSYLGIFFLCMILDQCPIFFQSNSFKVKLKDKLIGKSQCISPWNKKPFSIFWGPQLYLYPETPGIPPSDQAEFLVHVEPNSYLEKDVLACETLERRWREGVGSNAETKKFGMRGPQ